MLQREDLLRMAEGPGPGEVALRGVVEMHEFAAWVLPCFVCLWALSVVLCTRPPPSPSGLFPAAIGLGFLLAALGRGLWRRREWARRATLFADSLVAAGPIVACWALEARFAYLFAVPVSVAAAYEVAQLARPSVRALFVIGPPPTGPLAAVHAPSLGRWAGWAVFFCAVPALAAAQLRLGAGSLLSGWLADSAIVGGAVLGAALLVIGGGTVLGPGHEPSPANCARIVALRAEGRTLRQIAHTLSEEGRMPPGGNDLWRGRRLRAVLFAAGVIRRRQRA